MKDYRVLFSKKREDIPAIYKYLMPRRLHYIHQTELAVFLAVIAAGFCYVRSNTNRPSLALIVSALMLIISTAASDFTLEITSKLDEEQASEGGPESRYEYLDRQIHNRIDGRPISHFVGKWRGFVPLYGMFPYVVYFIIVTCLVISSLLPNI